MLLDKPIINSGPCGLANDLHGNHVGQFDSRGNFTQFGNSLPTARVEAGGYVRDKITDKVIGRVQGTLPMQQHNHHYEDRYRNNSIFNDNNSLLSEKKYNHLESNFPSYKYEPINNQFPKPDTFKPTIDYTKFLDTEPDYLKTKQQPLPFPLSEQENYKPKIDISKFVTPEPDFPKLRHEPVQFPILEPQTDKAKFDINHFLTTKPDLPKYTYEPPENPMPKLSDYFYSDEKKDDRFPFLNYNSKKDSLF